jgi:hypothetical protein
LSSNPTQAPSVTPTRIPSITVIPATPIPGHTVFSLNLLLHGIGAAGDNVNPSGGGNRNPVTPRKQIVLEVYNATGSLVMQPAGLVEYNTTNGNFKGTIDMGTLPTGYYTVIARIDKYLHKRLAGIVNVTAGTANTIAQFSLVAGDTDNSNRLNVLDYNRILDCFSGLSPARNCADPLKKQQTDVNDDGNVDQFDYNLFLRELSVQSGE